MYRALYKNNISTKQSTAWIYPHMVYKRNEKVCLDELKSHSTQSSQKKGGGVYEMNLSLSWKKKKKMTQ